MKIGLENKNMPIQGKTRIHSLSLSAHPNSALPIRENTKIPNTTASIKQNTCGRLSFKGVESTLNKESISLIERLGRKIAGSSKTQKTLTKFGDQLLMAEATVALFATAIARPLTIMLTPTKNEENKQKNKYASVKSIASGVVGFVTTFIVTQPFKKASEIAQEELKASNKLFKSDQIDLIAKYLLDKKNGIQDAAKQLTDAGIPESIIKLADDVLPVKDIEKMASKLLKGKKAIQESELPEALLKGIQSRLKNYSSTLDMFLNKANGPVFWPFKAALTVALVPVILSAIGIKKSDKKPEKKADGNQTTPSTNVVDQKAKQKIELLTPKTETKAVFQSFAGVTNNDN